MSRDFLIAEPPQGEPDNDENLANFFAEMLENNKRLIQQEKRLNPQNRLSVVLDTPGAWNASGYNPGATLPINQAPIKVHFESNGKKVSAYYVLIGWDLVNYVYVGVNGPPVLYSGGGQGIILNNSPFNTGTTYPPILDLRGKIDTLQFLYSTTNPAQTVYVEPQVQRNFTVDAGSYGVISLYAWGE